MKVSVPQRGRSVSDAVAEKRGPGRRRSFSIPQGILLMAVVMAIVLATACGNQNSQEVVSAGGEPDAVFTLTTGMDGGRLVFIGVGGGIDAVVNPTLSASQGERVKIVLVNGGGVHDIALPDFGVQSAQVVRSGEETTVSFTDQMDGEFIYYCSLPGHRQAGMVGRLVAGPAVQP